MWSLESRSLRNLFCERLERFRRDHSLSAQGGWYGEMISQLPDDALALVLWQVPELGAAGFPRGCWAACAAVCRRWSILVASGRTRLRCVVGAGSARGVELASAVRSLGASRRPLAAIAIRWCCSVDNASADAIDQLCGLVGKELTALELTGVAEQSPQASERLSALVGAVGSTLAPLSLRHLDLSWSDATAAAVSGRVSRLHPRRICHQSRRLVTPSPPATVWQPLTAR